MVTVNVHEAKTSLSSLLARVEAGEEVVIARNGTPVARLVRCAPLGKRRPGMWYGRVSLDEGIFDDSFFFDPLPEDELALWEGVAHVPAAKYVPDVPRRGRRPA